MKNNKKRGFTLTELLVVIAILAILATVSVVGYTAFIERASVSNDENIVTQLNKFLVALQADHTSDFYGDEITEDNVWEVTQTILKDSGLNELEAQSAKHGYQIYFKFNEDGIGGEYVLEKAGNVAVPKSGFKVMLDAFADDETTPARKPGLFEKDGIKYFLVATKGSAIAEFVNAFYKLNSLEGDTYSAKLDYLFNSLKAQVETDKFANYGSQIALLYKTVFVTNEGNYVVTTSADHTYIVVAEGTRIFGNTKKQLDGNYVYISASNPLATVSTNTTIVLPENVTLIANSLNIVPANENVKVTIVINSESWDKLLGDGTTAGTAKIDAYFTTANATIVVGGVEHVLKDGTEVYTKVADGEGEYVCSLSYNASLVSSFKFEFSGVSIKKNESSAYLNKTGTEENPVYTINLAFNHANKITIIPTGFVDANGSPNVSTTEVIWTSSSDIIKVENGVCTLNTTFENAVTEATVTATTTDGSNVSQSVTFKVVKPTSATITFNGKPFTMYPNADGNFSTDIAFTSTSASKFAFTGFKYDYNISNSGIADIAAPTVSYDILELPADGDSRNAADYITIVPTTPTTMLVEHGNKLGGAQFATSLNRASAKTNLYLPKGTVITYKGGSNYQWLVGRTTSETSIGFASGAGYKPSSAWAHTITTWTVDVSGWYGISFARADGHNFNFGEGGDSANLFDYVSIVLPASVVDISEHTVMYGNKYPGGTYASDTNRISLVKNLYLTAGQTIKIKDGYEYAVYKANNEVDFTSSAAGTSGWAYSSANSFTATSDGYYGVAIRKPDNSNFDLAEGTIQTAPLFSFADDTMTITKQPGTAQFTYTIPGFVPQTFTVSISTDVSLFKDANTIIKDGNEEKKYTNLDYYVVGNSGAIPLNALFTYAGGDIAGKLSVKIEYNLRGNDRGTIVDATNCEAFTWDASTGLTGKTFEIPSTVRANANNGHIYIHLGYTTEDGEYYSNRVKVRYVAGKNVNTATDWVSGTSLVLHDDIKTSTLVTVTNGGIYGNNFKVEADIAESGSSNTKYFISLNDSVVENLILVGPVYTNYYYSGNLKENAFGIVSASGENTIKDSYAFGLVAPVGVNAGNLEIDNSVIEGGALANIFFFAGSKGNLTLKDSITIQNADCYYKSGSSKPAYGLGIFLDTSSYSKVTLKGNTHQYNFISKDLLQKFKSYGNIWNVGTDPIQYVMYCTIDDLFSRDNIVEAKHNGGKYINLGIIHDHSQCNDSGYYGCGLVDADEDGKRDGITNSHLVVDQTEENRYKGLTYSTLTTLNGVGGLTEATQKDYQIWSYSCSDSGCAANTHADSVFIPTINRDNYKTFITNK